MLEKNDLKYIADSLRRNRRQHVLMPQVFDHIDVLLNEISELQKEIEELKLKNEKLKNYLTIMRPPL